MRDVMMTPLNADITPEHDTMEHSALFRKGHADYVLYYEFTPSRVSAIVMKRYFDEDLL